MSIPDGSRRETDPRIWSHVTVTDNPAEPAGVVVHLERTTLIEAHQLYLLAQCRRLHVVISLKPSASPCYTSATRTLSLPETLTNEEAWRVTRALPGLVSR
jgi:hypothetical protein